MKVMNHDGIQMTERGNIYEKTLYITGLDIFNHCLQQ